MLKDEKNEKYKYTDITTLINDTEKNIYNLCIKVQAYTKENYLHKVAVKAFCKKQKFILALKSLLFLKDNSKNSEEYYSSLIIFEDYFTKNQEKIKETVITTVKNNLEFISNKENFNKELKEIRSALDNNINSPMENVVNLIKNFVYLGENNSKEIEKISFLALDVDKNILRKIQSEKYLFVEMFLKLFTSNEIAEKFKVNFIKFLMTFS